MKRGTPDHPKTKHLASILGIPKFQVVGILESIWHFCMSYARRGDIGRWSDDAICAAIEWDGDSSKLIDALVNAGWFDVDSTYRLLVHDWLEHADQGVGRSFDVKKLGFAMPTPGNASIQLADTSEKLSSGNLSGGGAVPDVASSDNPPSPRLRGVAVPSIPTSLDTPDFNAAWASWTTFRKQLHKPLTQTTIDAQLAKLAKAGPTAAIAMIEQSIEHGWQGLFEPRGNATAGEPPGLTPEEMRAATAKGAAQAAEWLRLRGRT